MRGGEGREVCDGWRERVREGGRWGGWRKMGEKDKGMDGRREENKKKGREIKGREVATSYVI